MRRSTLALILLCAVGPATVALDGAEPAKRRALPKASSLERCEDCRTSLRRRVAVMPVTLEVALEIQMSRSGLAEGIQRRLRELLSSSENVRALEPGELGMASETTRGSATNGRALVRERRTPAQAEVLLTVSDLKVTTEELRASSLATEQAIRDAVDLENRSGSLSAEASRRESQIEGAARAAYAAAAGDVNKSAALECIGVAAQGLTCGGDWNCVNRSQQQIRDCQNSVRARYAQRGSIAADAERSRLTSEVMGLRADSESLKGRADALRRNASINAESESCFTRRVRAGVTIGWRIVDSRWGASIKGGSSEGTATGEAKGLSRSTPFSETSTSTRSRDEVVVNEAVGAALEKIAGQVSNAMGGVSPRVKVVKSESSLITINAGSVLGATVGDTFGLVSRGKVMTDPDTGLPLEATPRPVGKYRIVEVAENLSIAEPVERAGQINRGDELEWVGVYGPHPKPAPAVAAETAPSTTPRTSVQPTVPFAERVMGVAAPEFDAPPAAQPVPTPVPPGDPCPAFERVAVGLRDFLDEMGASVERLSEDAKKDIRSVRASDHFYGAQRALEGVVAMRSDPSMQFLPRSVTGPLFSEASNTLTTWKLQIEALNRTPYDLAAGADAIAKARDSVQSLFKAAQETFTEATARCPGYGRAFNEKR